MREIKEIIIHCSDSLFGSMELINQWHKERGWDGIGYHYVIGNAYPESVNFKSKEPMFAHDGFLEAGRPIVEIGAHCRGYNKNSIGICLIGKRNFTWAQFSVLKKLIKDLKLAHNNPEIIGHYELYPGKTCPNINMVYLRERLSIGD